MFNPRKTWRDHAVSSNGATSTKALSGPEAFEPDAWWPRAILPQFGRLALESLDIGRIDRRYEIEGETYRVSILDDQHPDRESCENAAATVGIPLPVQHRARWTAADPAFTRSWFVLVVGPNGLPDCAFGASLLQLKALPRHFLLRVERFRSSAKLNGHIAGMTALRDLARTSSRVLRIHLELFSPHAAERRALGLAARDLGFRTQPVSRIYNRTVGVDLHGSYDDVFSRLRHCARRNIKQALKSPVAVMTVTDPSLVPRLNGLWLDTFTRSGGPVDAPDFARLMRFCEANPELARFVGLFRTDTTGSSSLIAFSVGRFHGDHAELTYSASSRPHDLKISMAYPLMWDLLRWAKDGGAEWFDVGGVTAPNDGSAHDALGGISAFKRHFSVDVMDVGEEWFLDLRPVRSALARAVSGVAGWLRLTAPVATGAAVEEIAAVVCQFPLG